MALSWNEIKSRALSFQNEWKDETRERAEKDSFYNDFFNVFGISRRRVAIFEEAVKKLNNKQGFIDVFWKGKLLIEHKSFGKDLSKAKGQAFDYLENVEENDLPRYILVSDFQNFELYDLETKEINKFKLKDFHKNTGLFSFIAGYKKKTYKDLEPANIIASEKMGKLHDALLSSGYTEENLEQFLVRLLFCLFADDTGIFENSIFTEFCEEKTTKDGSDAGSKLTHLFQILDTKPSHRQKDLDEHLAAFPYVNGGLFAGNIKIPSFNSKMREALLECCYFDWSQISPAIFGSLFQSVADKNKRRELGEHYTSENNIMKTIHPLFLDDLWSEFEKSKKNKKKLREFHKKLASLKFFDPACGCGNFLVIAYREIRKLELEVLRIIHKDKIGQMDSFSSTLSFVDVDNFYGIEIDEFPAKIAQTALWLMDHKMNLELSEVFGYYFARIPLKKEARIVRGNALTIDWKDVVSPKELSYVLGNPPFVGSKFLTSSQRDEMKSIFHNVKGAGVLDYVTAWYKKASEFIQNTKIKCAFVSTNSITQGEQVGILWNNLLNKLNIKIHFAHRTFAWNNEAKGKAAVHCVIIGFGAFDIKEKRLFSYEDIKGKAHEDKVENINPYLMEGKNIVVLNRSTPITKEAPKIFMGNKPIDGGFYLFTNEEKIKFIKNEPKSEKWFKIWKGADEFINNKKRWCLHLKNCQPNELKGMPLCIDRIKKVSEYRKKSISISTRKLGDTPTKFHIEVFPKNNYIVIPSATSNRRKYIPIGFENKNVITSNLCLIIPEGNLYHFAILTSLIHNIWMRYTCGRLGSGFRYSNSIVYNNFPWPQKVSTVAKNKIEKLAQNVLDVRASFPDCSLADLYDPNTMPPALVKAHNDLDKAVDKLYKKGGNFKDERDRIEFLFDLYSKYLNTGSLI